jgi:hypothetical protein
VTQIENVQARIYAAGGVHIGNLVSWNAGGVDVSREAVRAALASVQFEHLAPTVEPATALTRAAGSVHKPADLDIRPFARPNRDTAAALGFYVRSPGTGESGDGWMCGARARIDANGCAVAMGPEGGAGEAAALTLAREVADKANRIVSHAQTLDVSAALVAAMKELGGVALRDRGGFYLVPPASCERWDRLAALVEPFGITPITIEMHDAPSNVKAAAAAVRGTLEMELASLATDLETAKGEGLRASTVDRRIRLCDELTARADLFRNVLRDAATSIEARVAALKAGFASELAKDDAPNFQIKLVADETA